MSGQPLGPAAIMAAHEDHVWPNTRGCLYADMDRDKPETQRCVPHRLAAALAAAQERADRLDSAIMVMAVASQNNETRMHWAEADRDHHAAEAAAARAVACDVGARLGWEAAQAYARNGDFPNWWEGEIDNPYRAALSGEGAAEPYRRVTQWPLQPGDCPVECTLPERHSGECKPPGRGEGAADQPQELEGCPATVWDGPYSFPCGMGAESGRCAWHGRFRP